MAGCRLRKRAQKETGKGGGLLCQGNFVENLQKNQLTPYEGEFSLPYARRHTVCGLGGAE